MRALTDIAADNLQLWHESGARARALCLLQQEQLGRAAAGTWMEEGKPPVPPTIP